MRKFLVPILILFFSVNSVHSQDIINYFQVSDNIAKPVTIKTNLGTYKIYGGERIDGNLYSVTAYDANGNKIVQNTPYKTETATGKPTIRYYHFKTIYQSETVTEPNNNRYNSYSNQPNSGITDHMSNYARQASRYYIEGYPNLQVRVGYSLIATETLSVKIQLGGMGGYNLIGAVGKNIFRNDGGLSMFYGGVGYYSGDTYNDISFSVLFGASRDFFLCGELEYSYYFDAIPRLGLFVAGRLGCYFSYSFMLDLHGGITWKLF